MAQLTIRIQHPFNEADRRYLEQIVREESETAGRRIGPEGEIVNLTALANSRARRRPGGGNDHPTPPGGMALRVAA